MAIKYEKSQKSRDGKQCHRQECSYIGEKSWGFSKPERKASGFMKSSLGGNIRTKPFVSSQTIAQEAKRMNSGHFLGQEVTNQSDQTDRLQPRLLTLTSAGSGLIVGWGVKNPRNDENTVRTTAGKIIFKSLSSKCDGSGISPPRSFE